MAKMFYTLEEAKGALGKSEDEIKQYARDGRLREFRDGPRLMFKADQVEQLKSEISGTDQVDLGVSDSGGLIGLVDTTGASGTSITLTDDPGQGTGTGMRAKDDTALAADLGLSGGSMGGVPSPARTAPGALSGTGLSGTASGSRAGINVFGEDSEHVDPSAQTAITGGVREQINLEGVGSGSGLLDLTRDADDTSLGAVLDEMSPGVSRGRGQMEAVDTGGMELEEPSSFTRTAAAPVYVQAADPMAPAFGAMALGAAGVLIFAVYVLFASLAGTWPDAVQYFNRNAEGDHWYMVLVFGFGLCAVLFVIGLLIGKTTAGRRA
ncbi:MAG TPA: hypothetical protein VFC78_02880 [Tepidisphaeraceae bacterium]|nr:hypothetical protein [Tepidisphaeraceae bacterium]